MDSDRRRRWQTAAGAVLLGAGSYTAGAATQPGALAAGALAALLGMAAIWRPLAASRAAAPLEVPVRGGPEHAHLEARALTLESRLEFAPIALFCLRDGATEPLNTAARRLLAPGRVADVSALHQALDGIAAGQRKLVQFDTESNTERALACAGAMTVAGQQERLVALMPVEDELSAEAMQAWQKLVHVLTHEIMNSLTPVASLSQTSRLLLAGASLPGDLAADLDTALDAISRRAESLSAFVRGYRALAAVPEAQTQIIEIQALFARLSVLVAPQWAARNGRAVLMVEPESLQLQADPGQLEQALVALLQNAAEATAGVTTPEVHVTARLSRGGRLRMEVNDNGRGVPDDIVADIFTPFYTTKLKGSGIGLAMVRQLVHRNGGTVRYARAPGGGARFVLTF
jgi:signal transduction histidine kinase